MRSTIFDKEPSRQISDSKYASKLKQKNASPMISSNGSSLMASNNSSLNPGKKSRSSSPYIGPNGAKVNRVTSSSGSNTTPNSNRKVPSRPSTSASNGVNGATSHKPNWNFDEMVNSYNENGSLPNILSPTLPTQFDSDDDKSAIKRDPPRLSLYDGAREKEDDDGKRDNESGRIRSSPVDVGMESDVEIKKHNGDSDDDLPLSMLSPTLPSIFNQPNELSHSKKESPTKLAQPIPKRHTESTILNQNASSKPRFAKKTNVRWINKLNDQKRPRFLLRITYDPEKKLSDKKYAGLGISVGKPDNNLESNRELVERQRNEREEKDRVKMIEDKEKKKENERIKESERKEKEREERERKQYELRKEREAKEKEKRQQESKQERVPKEKDIEPKEREMKKLKDEKIDVKEKIVPPAPPIIPPKTKPSGNGEANRKAEQLRQLNEDLMRKEEEKIKDIERIRVEKNQSPSLDHYQDGELNKKSQTDYKDGLISKKNYWIKHARDLNNRIDGIGGFKKDAHKLIVMKFDLLLLYMIAYDYDEKSKLIMNILPSERNWNSIYQDVTTLINQLENYNKTIDASNKFKNYIMIFIGILLQLKGIIHKRVNSILQKVIESYIKKKSNQNNEVTNELNNKIIELQQQLINNWSSIITNFAKAQNYLDSLQILIKLFPNTWQKRKSKIQPPTTKLKNSFVPNNDSYYLPINSYSDLNEISGFMYNIIKEFNETFMTENSYKLISGYK